MAKDGSCLFRLGYTLYTRTRLGYYYHLKDIKKAREKLGDNGHSELTHFDFGNLRILPIPMLLDNYAYLVSDIKNKKSVLIDPGHAEAAQKVLTMRNIHPDAILITHKHWDHSGGNRELRQLFPNIPIYGGSLDNIPDCTHLLIDQDEIEFGDLKFQVLFTPGHTVGHIVYLLHGNPFKAEDSLFSGDCLFLAGCGRMFEAPSSVMLSSLERLSKLNDKTLLWPGHEYAIENLKFAHHLNPDNDALQKKFDWVKIRRESSLCTCPSTIGEEKMYNPFLRTSNEDVLRGLGMIDNGEFVEPSDESRARALQLIREQKDAFNYKL
ncbi:unnamed protein product [Lymnaea stagnalis]|uniref:Metallo-beta-lactamase domain-containing protein n=1 Tax=Lymnaea stagnalis TaxID=6523 RepID=A0AAV2HP47_LYMST